MTTNNLNLPTAVTSYIGQEGLITSVQSFDILDVRISVHKPSAQANLFLSSEIVYD